MKRVAIYARVSTADRNQTVENQLRDLQAVAARMKLLGLPVEKPVEGPVEGTAGTE